MKWILKEMGHQTTLSEKYHMNGERTLREINHRRRGGTLLTGVVANTLACTAAVSLELQLQSVGSSPLRQGTWLVGGGCVGGRLRLCDSL